MQQKVKLAMIALCYSPLLFAQNATEQKIANGYIAVNPTAQKSSPPEGGELLCIKLV